VFVHQHHLHPQHPGFVGEHVSDNAAGHLMQALVGGRPMVGVRPFANSTDVANDDRLHPLLVQGGDKVGGELVQRIFQLIR
jgi:hypothetical protein